MKDSAKIKALLWGISVMLLVSLGVGALMAAFVESGMLRAGALTVVSWGITVIAGLLGGLVTAKRAGKLRLPLALAGVLCYLLLIFVLRGLLFHTVSETPWIVPALTASGGVIGALIASSGDGKRHRNKIAQKR
jgi:FtsH-binding integral membrane protein